ncbi:MAG TPA: ATP-binding protein, partial [Pilimelia sp.]|nr:ATP-binding protein [Pilimelia sp.]
MVDAQEGAGRSASTLHPLLARTFDAEQVTELRHAVARCAEESGLSGHPLEDFVLAVNELATNAVRHGGGRGL